MVTMVTTFLRLSFRDTRDNNCFSIYGYHHPEADGRGLGSESSSANMLGKTAVN